MSLCCNCNALEYESTLALYGSAHHCTRNEKTRCDWCTQRSQAYPDKSTMTLTKKINKKNCCRSDAQLLSRPDILQESDGRVSTFPPPEFSARLDSLLTHAFLCGVLRRERHRSPPRREGLQLPHQQRVRWSGHPDRPHSHLPFPRGINRS